MKRFAALLFLGAVPLFCQSNRGELFLRVTDASGHGVKAALHILCEANEYNTSLQTDEQGSLDLQRLPFGKYQIEVDEPDFAPLSESLVIRSSLPSRHLIQLKIRAVNQSVTVQAANTLIDPDLAGAVSQIGSGEIVRRLGSVPGRSLQDLVNSQPGWLFEGNAVLHPRGSENQTQFVVDGTPLTDNRSPGFGPEIAADDVESISIYTAGIPAEYGRRTGGVIEVNTLQDAQPGFHGAAVLSAGSFATGSAFGKGQLGWGGNALGGSASGNRTDRYLNPVVPQNYSNTGTLADFSAHYERDLTPSDRFGLSVRHELARYDIPNEQVQQAAGQRQTADNIETMGVASYGHILSPRTLASFRAMVRDNENAFESNPESTPIMLTQRNRFREAFFKGTVTTARGRHEWKVGAESDNTFLHENLAYNITDATRYDDGTPLTFAFAARRPDLEQSAFVEDLIRLDNWTIRAGLRWDHYQLLVNKQAVSPRFSVSRFFPSASLVTHFSYDRVFQTPSFENILLSSSDAVDSLAPSSFLRLPVEPSHGDYYEGGFSKAFFAKVKLDANYFRRYVNNYADDDQIDNTAVSFPIAFSKSVIYGAETALSIPDWRHVSAGLSYSYMVGNAWFPVTGGLFLGEDAVAAAAKLTGHFPDSQDQRNTVRGRVRYQAMSRFWIAAGANYDSGLPFQFTGEQSEVLAQYGQRVLDRINFTRGRIFPSSKLNASAGAEIYKTERVHMELQADGLNLSNVLDVIDFGGLFSGNAIGPSRSFALRLATSF